jgi:hypothetical protein
MAGINLTDLSDRNKSGTDLFNDLENFMIELSDNSEQIIGGMMNTSMCRAYSESCLDWTGMSLTVTDVD